MKELLKNLELAVGKGSNHFTMKRGSFSYRQIITRKTQLKRISVQESAGGFNLLYRDPLTGQIYMMAVTEDAGRWKVHLVLPERADVNRFWVSFPADPHEHIYGCGEVYSRFDLKGEKVRIFVAEHQNSRRITSKMIRGKLFGRNPERASAFRKYESYYAQPTFVSSKKYYFHADIQAYSEFDFSHPAKTVIYTQEPPVFYMEQAESFPELSKKLGNLLGHQRLLPDWIYDGAILAVQGGTGSIDEKIEKARAAGAKLCGIWSQDWCGCRKTAFGYQVMWNWEWDRDLYLNLDQKIKEWRDQGIRFLGYINPFMAIEKDLYRYASGRGWCVKDKEGKDYLVTITTFPAAMIDLTNPEAYTWYKSVIKKNMIDLGMGGWMADFGEYLPTDCVLHDGDPALLHNQWPAIWAKLNKEAIEEAGKSDDIFFFTRAGHTGTISASAMMWTGDQHVDWSMDDGLPSVIPATLSLAMSGFGLTHSDVGGYTTVVDMTRSRELLLRWEEMNAFSPLFRSHEGNQPARNVQCTDDDELLAQLAGTSRLHAALKPYLKVLVRENAGNCTPVMRPLFYHYDEAPAYTEKTEYLLGRDILVAPVIKSGADSRRVWLPKDEWVHLFNKYTYGGGTFEVDAPIGEPPVFIRKDSPFFNMLMSLLPEKADCDPSEIHKKQPENRDA